MSLHSHRWVNPPSPEQVAAKKLSDRAHRFRRRGLTIAEGEAMEQRPCAICGKSGGQIDHDHETGVVRDTLCGHCNRGLGMFRDNPNSLRAAIAYLEKHSPEVLL